MSDIYNTLDEATTALASTAERAAVLIRTESARAREEATHTRQEIDEIRTEIRAAKTEFEAVRTALANQDGERDRIRRSAGWAWSAVGLMAACIMICVGWTAMELTRGHDTASGLSGQVADLHQTLQLRDSEVAALRTQLEDSRLAEIRASAELNLRTRAATFQMDFQQQPPQALVLPPFGPFTLSE